MRDVQKDVRGLFAIQELRDVQGEEPDQAASCVAEKAGEEFVGDGGVGWS